MTALNRTLDQELLALERGASLECPVCGEFVLRTDVGIRCPECDSRLGVDAHGAASHLQLSFEAG